MGDKKRIDRLFQEHFKDFEVAPDPALWSSIESQLGGKKKKRRIIPVWWYYSGTAAVIVLLFSISALSFFNTTVENTAPSTITNVNENQAEQNTTNSIKKKEQAVTKVANTENPISAENVISKHTKSRNNSKNSITTVPSAISAHTVNSSSSKKSQNLNVAKSIGAKRVSNGIIEVASGLKTHHKVKNTIENSNPTNTINTLKTTEQQIAINDTNHSTPPAKNNNNTIALDTSSNPILDPSPHKKPSIEDAIALNNELTVSDSKKVTTKKWGVAPNIAPVYYNSLSQNGSSLNSEFDNNTKSGEVNLSYGINASYTLNKKVTIRSGINRVNLGFNTNNVVALRNVPQNLALGNLESIPSLPPSEDAITTANSDVAFLSAESVNASRIDEFGSTTSINQSFDFIEVPLEIQYALSTKRLGIHLIGGFSSFFLSNANTTSEINGQLTDLVEPSDNINKTSYSANLGLGLNYKVSKKINFNLEPLFKYQINTFRNTSGNFQPFIIGVYTGFGIKL